MHLARQEILKGISQLKAIDIGDQEFLEDPLTK